MRFREGVFIQLVVNPAPLLPIGHDAGVLQYLEMERQPRLGCIKRGGEIANAALAASQQVNDLETCLVGEGVKDFGGTIGGFSERLGHELNISKNLGVSTPAGFGRRISHL